MRTSLMLSLSIAALALPAGPVRAADPPVDVEVLEDEAEDFFSKKAEPEEEERHPGRADPAGR